MKNNRITVTFDESIADFIISCFKEMPKRCIFCNKKINSKNLGGVLKKGFICKSIACLVQVEDI